MVFQKLQKQVGWFFLKSRRSGGFLVGWFQNLENITGSNPYPLRYRAFHNFWATFARLWKFDLKIDPEGYLNMSDVQKKLWVDPKTFDIWSPARKSRNTWQISRYFAKISHFENQISPWKNNIFWYGFFPDKVWLWIVRKWALHRLPKLIYQIGAATFQYSKNFAIFSIKLEKITKYFEYWKVAVPIW